MATKSKASKKRRKHTAPKTVLKLPDLDQAKSSSPEQPEFEGCATRLQACHRRVRGLVLFRATTVV
jgi:hypothetical protein